jgi:CheY-like chemotaxis protein
VGERGAIASGKRVRIVVIDDDPAIGLLMRLNLEQHGCDVVLKDDGVGGLVAAQDLQPDAIVLDLMMPVVDGFQVLTELRNDERTREIPVVVLTAVALAGAKAQALERGACAVVTKPFQPDRVVEVLEAVLAAGRGTVPTDGAPPARRR